MQSLTDFPFHRFYSFVFFALLAGLSFAAPSEADEKAVWDLWRAHLSASNNHEAVFAAFQQSQKDSPTNTLAAVLRGLCAWHLLKAARTNDAARLLETMASDRTPGAASAAGVEMARRWLTRLDHEKVKEALRSYYRRHIAYPPGLDALNSLPAASRPPPADRWNAPWEYRLEPMPATGLNDQKYSLQSSALKDTSSLEIALDRPYAAAITIKPVALVPTASGAVNVTFEPQNQQGARFMLSEGSKASGISLAYVGIKIIVLSDGDHWLVTPKPR